jgi:hypothetical protein
MKAILSIILISFCLSSLAQQSISEILDKNIQQRVLLIRSRTDSLLKKLTNQKVFSKFAPNFGVTYLIGKFYNNYKFLNERKPDPEDIYELTQYYYIHDAELGISDTVGVYYSEFKYQFAPEANSLEVRFESNSDFLKLKALNYLYKPSTQQKLRKLMKEKDIKAPSIKISVDRNSTTYLVLVKSNGHYFPL